MKDLIPIGFKLTQTLDAGRMRDRGFTLIELLVTMVIASILMAAIYSVYAGLTRSYTTQNAAADVQQAVRASIDYMAEDIMMAGLTDPDETYGTDVLISEAGSTKISFNLDRDMDGDTDGKTPDDTDISENITYELVGNQLKITDDIGTSTLIDNVENFQFRYFRENASDTPTNNDLVNGYDLIGHFGLSDPIVSNSDLASIRTVEISITVNEPAGREGMIQRTYTTRVRCRNAGI